MSAHDEPLFRKVDCVALPVDDLDRAIGFYRGLGHRLIWRTTNGAALRLPDSNAELVLQTERPNAEVDIAVTSVEEAIERFTAAGGTVVTAPFDIPIGRCVIVADPWGNQLVLLDNSRGRFATDADGNVTGIDPD